MNERAVLEISLWVFTVGFMVKGVVFGGLAWVMRHQRNSTPLGNALRWHYISLGLQAFVLATIYLYYSTALRGYDEWLNAPRRITLCITATVLVIWATVMGFRLMIAYFLVTHGDPDENEPTNERQDIREVEQNVRETFQLEQTEQAAGITLRQDNRQSLMDARQVLQDARQRRQERYQERRTE